MAQTLDQIFASLGSIYDPQTDLVRRQQADIPTQIAEEEKGLQAKQERSFGEILGGARQRGLGFAGIPLQEQAKYTATEFLPALARLRQGGRQQATSLEEAILGINERRRTFAQQILDGELTREQRERELAEQRRQFDAQLQESRRASSAAASSGFSPTLGGGSPNQKAASSKKVSPFEQKAYNDIASRINAKQNPQELLSDYRAAEAWYKKTGNPVDFYKMRLYKQLVPNIFGGGR